MFTRNLTRIFTNSVIVLVSCFGLSSLAHASTDTGTLSVGYGVGCNGGIGQGGEILVYGYLSGSYGSYSPTGLTGGTTVYSIQDYYVLTAGNVCSGSSTSLLEVTGFSVDPGQDWLSSITCNGVENTGSGAASFYYSSGKAYWTWSQLFGLEFKGGSNVSCSLTHS